VTNICIIIAKPEGVAMPSDKVIETCWNNNYDGFGLAYLEKGMVYIIKGALDYKSALEIISQVPNPEEKHVVMHFRTATSGLISRGNCHPMPITDKVELLVAQRVKTKIAIAHNGVIFDFHRSSYGVNYGSDAYWDNLEKFGGYYGTSWRNKKTTDKLKFDPALDLSDTQQFVKEILAGMGKSMFQPKVMTLIQRYTESKFAFISKRGITLLGKFFVDKDIYYSNEEYKAKPKFSGSVWAKCELCGGWHAESKMKKVDDVKICESCHTKLMIAETP